MTATEASREYRKKHNYMDEPGDTDMPEYSVQEMKDIEEGRLRQCDIAKKYGRSVAGVSDKSHRMMKEDRFRRVRMAKAGLIKDSEIYQPRKPIVVDEKAIDAVLSGDLDIAAFVNM